jgi:hypothetical protein
MEPYSRSNAKEKTMKRNLLAVIPCPMGFRS